MEWSLASIPLQTVALRRWRPPPGGDARLEVFLIAFQIESTVFKLLTVRFACPAKSPTIPENLISTTFQNCCITLVPSGSRSLVSCQPVKVGFRRHLPHRPSYASRVAGGGCQCWIYAPRFDPEARKWWQAL